MLLPIGWNVFFFNAYFPPFLLLFLFFLIIKVDWKEMDLCCAFASRGQCNFRLDDVHERWDDLPLSSCLCQSTELVQESLSILG